MHVHSTRSSIPLIIITLATLRLHIQDVPEFNDIVEEQLSLEFVLLKKNYTHHE